MQICRAIINNISLACSTNVNSSFKFVTVLCEYFIRIGNSRRERWDWKEEGFPGERAGVQARCIRSKQIHVSQSSDEFCDPNGEAFGLLAQLRGGNAWTTGRFLSSAMPNDSQQITSSQFQTILSVPEIVGAGTTSFRGSGILSRIRRILRGSKFVIIST